MDAILRLGMNDRHGNAFKHPQRHKTLFVVPEAVVFKGESGTAKYPLRIHEIQPVVLQVALALNLVPRKPRE